MNTGPISNDVPSQLLRSAMYAWVYALPWPLCALAVLTLHATTGSWPFALHAMLLPIVYGYVAPGIATNVLHNWHFRGPFRMGNYYVHHGVMYAGNMMPLLAIAMLGQTPGAMSIGRATSIVCCTAALTGFVLWIHDIGIVRVGLVELFNRPARAGRSAAEIVAHYAPACFSLLGAGYAVDAAWAYQKIVIEGRTSFTAHAGPLALGIVLTFVLPSLAYRWAEREPS